MYTDDTDRPENDAGLTPAERELAVALRGLRPAAPRGIDRGAMLYEAGRAAAARSLFRWRMAATAAGILAVAAAGVMFAGRLDHPQIVRELVYVDRPATTPTPPLRLASTPTAAPADDVRLIATSGLAASPFRSIPKLGRDADYLVLRDRALRWGVAAAFPSNSKLPPARAAAINPQPLDINQLLDDVNDEPGNIGEGRRRRRQLQF
jgi:hypothetical protein